MRRFLEIVVLELRSLVRSKTVAILTLISIAWMLAFPHLLMGDGTDKGIREIFIHFSLGGVFALLVLALLSSATGSIAREREAHRLQLTLVRPVRYWAIALGKIVAHVGVGAFILAIACGALLLQSDSSKVCFHVLSPTLPSPREEAKAMYEHYMNDPDTPAAVKHTKKSIVLRLLETRALDHYQSIATNETARWQFADLEQANDKDLSVRMRFTNQYDLREVVQGEFRWAGSVGVVSNISQSVLVVPLIASDEGGEKALTFHNQSARAVMFRPRKDLNILVPADSFATNLLRAWIELVAILALIVSLGVFLSASLGRPVALFVAMSLLVVSEMSPSVIQQYPDELETNVIDRVGLVITRFAADIICPISAASPLEALSADECVETKEVLRLAFFDLLLAPLLLSLLSAVVLPRKALRG